MPAAVLPYWRLFLAGVREQSHYLAAALAGLFTNSVFGLLRASLLFAVVAGAGGSVGGYDRGSIAAYAWLTQALLGSVLNYAQPELAQRIYSGQITADFLRPISVQLAAIANAAGRAVFNLAPRAVPAMAIGALLTGMTMPSDPAAYLIGIPSVLLAIVVSSAANYVVATLAFWLVEIRGIWSLYRVSSTLLAGLVVPLSLMPDALRAIAYATPFPAMLMTPVNILSGRLAGADAWLGLAAQAGWLVVILALGALLTAAGRRKLEVQGG